MRISSTGDCSRPSLASTVSGLLAQSVDMDDFHQFHQQLPWPTWSEESEEALRACQLPWPTWREYWPTWGLEQEMGSRSKRWAENMPSGRQTRQGSTRVRDIEIQESAGPEHTNQEVPESSKVEVPVTRSWSKGENMPSGRQTRQGSTRVREIEIREPAGPEHTNQEVLESSKIEVPVIRSWRKGENMPSGRQTKQGSTSVREINIREPAGSENTNQEVLESSKVEVPVAVDWSAVDLEKFLSDGKDELKMERTALLEPVQTKGVAMSASVEEERRGDPLTGRLDELKNQMLCTGACQKLQDKMATMEIAMKNMYSDMQVLNKMSRIQGKQMEDILKRLKDSEKSQGQEQRKVNGELRGFVPISSLTNCYKAPNLMENSSTSKGKETVLQTVQPEQNVVNPPWSMEVLYGDMACNLETYLDGSLMNAYAREDADRHRSYNVRFRGYWEGEVEENDPYYVVQNFKTWLKTGFSVPVDRIVGVWRTPMQRSKCPLLPARGLSQPTYLLAGNVFPSPGLSQPTYPAGYVKPRDLIVKMKSIADAEALQGLS